MGKLLICCFAILMLGNTSFAQKDTLDVGAGWEGNRKGYIVYRFAKLTKFPREQIKNQDYFHFGFLGQDTTTVRIYRSLKFARNFRLINLKRMKVHLLNSLDELDGMNVVYLNSRGGYELSEVEERLKGKPVLIVAEKYGYKEGMINFLKISGFDRYTVNEEKMAAAGLEPTKRLMLLAIKTRKDWNDATGLMEEALSENKDRIVLTKAELEVIAKQHKEKEDELKQQALRLDSLREEIEQQQRSLEATRKELEDETVRNKKQLAQLMMQKRIQESNLKRTLDQLASETEKLDEMQASFEVSRLKQDSILARKKEEVARNEKRIKEQTDILSQKQAMILEQKGTIAGQKNIIYLASLALIALLAVAFLIYRNYRNKKKTNQELATKNKTIEQQKLVVEEKNKEIVDSIQYAKRLQTAILPAPRLVKEWLNESFILYKPKDIVAGDFYWVENVGDEVLFAAADCTGHGVPGAMVSVVCANALKNSLKDSGSTDPGLLLNLTRDQVVEQFDKSDKEVKDGMDIALCALNLRTRKMRYAGANNPLWVVSKADNYQQFVDTLDGKGSALEDQNNADVRLVEVKGDKQPIGKHEAVSPFTTREMTLEKGDVVYVFSDGYADQFGGPKGKKLKYKPFKEILLSLYDKPMDEQRKTIDDFFEQWKGEHEQIDDICVIGVRV